MVEPRPIFEELLLMEARNMPQNDKPSGSIANDSCWATIEKDKAEEWWNKKILEADTKRATTKDFVANMSRDIMLVARGSKPKAEWNPMTDTDCKVRVNI